MVESHGWQVLMITIMTSSNRNIFRVTGEFPSQRPVARSFGVFFDLRLKTGLISNQDNGDFRGHRAHYGATVIKNIGSPEPRTHHNSYGMTCL